jgi:retron-type reverse transcriptase
VKIAENRGEPAGCPCEGRLETESSREARSGVSLKRTENDGAGSWLAKVLDRNNMNRAYKRVKENRGAPGIDGMTVDELLDFLKAHGGELVVSISLGGYEPCPVRRVEIQKPDGGIRELGVPTVVDRLIQLAIAQVLEPIFEAEFSESSYGVSDLAATHIRR